MDESSQTKRKVCSDGEPCTDKVIKKRPRGLKKKNKGNDVENDVSDRANGYERLELPEEVKITSAEFDDDSQEDGYCMYASAVVEVEKDNLPTAKKFFEGAIHNLQSLLEKRERAETVPEHLLLYTLGMSWCELGVLIEDTDYITRGLEHIKDVIKSGSTEAHVLMDAGQMVLSLYSLIHRRTLNALDVSEENEEDPQDRVDASSDEKEAVSEALCLLRKAIDSKKLESRKVTETNNYAPGQAMDKEPDTKSYSRLAATYTLNYSQLIDGEWRKEILDAALDFFKTSDLVDESSGAWNFKSLIFDDSANVFGLFLDHAEECASSDDYDSAIDSLKHASSCMCAAENEVADDDAQTKARILNMLSEMHVIAGNIYSEIIDSDQSVELPELRGSAQATTEESPSERQYIKAWYTITEAKELDPKMVPDELFESVKSLVQDDHDNDSDSDRT
eukprot:CFRG2492T1